jgi:peptidoglycan/xylan/chitin deacetylase (PgdA/CDA1 family)
MKTNVLITIDTEHSMGGYFDDQSRKPVPAGRIIWCRIGEKEYGINLIMDILDRYAFKGVFFVEVESRFYFGDQAIAEIIDHIQNRGHEVQLHTHPNYRTFKEKKTTRDDFRRYSRDEQTQIISEARQFMRENGVGNILAHRCGGFYSNQDTLAALQANGIRYSSNYNLAYPNCDYIQTLPLINDIHALNGGYEVPVTSYQEPEIRKKWNSLQLSAASYAEMTSVLDYAERHNTQVLTFLTHSFEFVRARDRQYQSVRPLHFLIRRFENFCRYLADNSDRFQVVTFTALDQLIMANPPQTKPNEVQFYKSTFLQTALRYLENAKGKIYLC